MKPMLACSTIPKVEDLNYPVVASPKMDGIRCLIVDGVAVSRNLKPIPNQYIQDCLAGIDAPLDGELILKSGDFNNVQSAVMSVEGRPDFEYVVFDIVTDARYNVRLHDHLQKAVQRLANPCVRIVESFTIESADFMRLMYKKWLDAGYEGAIVRDPNSPYKFGRSTLKQGWMLKLKVFNDAEACIIGFEELMHNENEAEIDELGYQRRSSHQANQVPGNTLGSLLCVYNGEDFKIGSGFTAEQRSKLWAKRDELLGKFVTFKYQEISKYGKPRFPVFKAIRQLDY